jgi:hypothetical protein
VPVAKEDAVRDIVVSLLLTLVTCGIYDLYWNYKQMKVFNSFLEREEFNFWLWFFMSLLTCGVFHIYYEYQMGIALKEIQKKYNLPVEEQLPMISILLSIFGLSLVVDAIHQNEINKIYRNHPQFT